MFKFLFIFYFFSFFAFAKEPVRAYVDHSVVSPQDTLTLTVEVEHGLRKSVRSPRLPKLEAFHLIRASQSHSFQFINGNMSGVKKYKYTLRPLKEGKFRIGSVEVVVDGNPYQTSPIEVEVSSKVKPRPTPDPFGSLKKFFSPHLYDEEQDGGGSPFFRSKPRPIQEQEVFVKLEMEKNTLYLGEMVLAEWFLYLPANRSVDVRSEVTKNAKLDGFWVESIVTSADSSSVPPKLEEAKGVMYRKQIITSSALFPVRTGTLSIGSLEVKNLFLGPFSILGSSQRLLKKSKERKVKVLPLPKQGKGDSFTEAVGDFEVLSEVNKKVIAAQEPLLYKVIFKGRGHPRLIRLPDLSFGSAFEVYDITESQSFSFSESLKTFEVILIPKSSGELLIPSFELTTFDPQLGIYKTHILPEVKIKVAGVSAPGGSKDKSELYFDSEGKTEKIKEGEDEVELQKKGMSLVPLMKETSDHYLIEIRGYLWFFVYGFLLVLFLISLMKIFLFFRRKDHSFKVKLKESVKRVDQAIKKKQWKQSGIELNQLMYSFFADISGQGRVVKNWDILLQNINPSIRVKYETRIRKLASYLEQLSFASFEEAGKLRNQQSVETLKNNLIELIQEISTEYSID